MSTRSTTSSMCDHDSMALEPGRSGDAPDRKRDADHDERSERTSWQCSRGRSRRAAAARRTLTARVRVSTVDTLSVRSCTLS